jgi:hypothetical protein
MVINREGYGLMGVVMVEWICGLIVVMLLMIFILCADDEIFALRDLFVFFCGCDFFWFCVFVFCVIVLPLCYFLNSDHERNKLPLSSA